MNVLIIGSGGRENAFAWKISQSKFLKDLFIAPGNAGTSQYGKNVELDIRDFEKVKDFVLQNKIKVVLVGPEEPLVLGIADFFHKDVLLKDIIVIGPTANGAMLEGSKSFSKAFMQRNQIPTARFQSFTKTDLHAAEEFLKELSPPYVLKADGLAAGKGVLILTSIEEAKKELKEILINDKFGKAGSSLVIEEFLDGKEVSVFVITDGTDYLLLPEAKDYKRIGEGDTGLNTGGMGAISPVAFADKTFMEKVQKNIIKPTIAGLNKEGIVYKGFIFFGLMNVKGEPFVIEYNCRMGDPETEAVIPRIKNDLLEIFLNIESSSIKSIVMDVDSQTATTVMLVSGGYPGNFEKGKKIHGLEFIVDSTIFHAGTKKDDNADSVVTSGGRVLAVTSLGKNIQEALDKTYESISKIQFDGMYYRKDIGKDLI